MTVKRCEYVVKDLAYEDDVAIDRLYGQTFHVSTDSPNETRIYVPLDRFGDLEKFLTEKGYEYAAM